MNCIENTMARLNFCEIWPANKGGAAADDFEKFSQDFIVSVLGLNVFKGPSRGADGGIDLGVVQCADGIKRNWLVSCKHFAHSGAAVGRGDEEDILDRLAEHNCSGFIGLYSTIASASLEQKLERLHATKGIFYELYNSERIETLLLDSVKGFKVAKRYFPKSIQNVWPQIISLAPTYTVLDAVQTHAGWIVPEESNGLNVSASNPVAAVRFANENAMLEIHAPMYLAAWKDAVRLFCAFFNVPDNGIESAQSVEELLPLWTSEPMLGSLKPMERWAVLAIWSLIDASKVRKILKSMHHDASQQDMDLLSFSFLAASTGTERRDILTRLFAYYVPAHAH